MVKLVRRGALVGLLAGVAIAVWKLLASRAPDTGGMTFEAQPFPSPPRPVPRPTSAPGAPTPAPSPTTTGAAAPSAGADQHAWVESVDGTCPVSHPVKAKLTSGIFHVPGGGSYDRTKADRCYRDAAAAEADGLRAPKR